MTTQSNISTKVAKCMVDICVRRVLVGALDALRVDTGHGYYKRVL